MLNLNISKSRTSHQILLPNYKPFILGIGNASFAASAKFKSVRKHENVRVGRASSKIKAMQTSTEKSITTTATAIITVQRTVVGVLTDLGWSRVLDNIADVWVKTLFIELVAAELDPKTGAKRKIEAYAHKKDSGGCEMHYESNFNIPEDFGEVGAITIENEHHKEMFVKGIALDMVNGGTIKVTCNSWIHSKFDNEEPRVFFVDKSYLPSNTPSGLKKYREKELQILRGDGTGERKTYERIYDYDVYNDLGDPDSSGDLRRPVLGGQKHPYPRRCRTGRARTETEQSSESRSRSLIPYVPRDEAFSDVKLFNFEAETVYSTVIQSLVPQIETVFNDELGFPNFTAIETLFNEGIELPKQTSTNFFKNIVISLLNAINVGKDILLFQKPEVFDRDRFSWFRDEEFARQTLAGLNPCRIELVTEWPLKSKLDPEKYGPAESAITTELIEKEIVGFTTVEKALEEKKLFILDYHDLLLPHVEEVRKLKGTTLYGSRTLFLLMPSGTLRPLAIELTRPQIDGKPQWKEVYQPCSDATRVWLWRLAKAHVLAHDSGFHQLVSHWLRTHCCTEPYVIATNRQLSAMHPIYKLLHPHLRYTMEINASARKNLINANGIIEKSFSPGKYSMEVSSAVYDQLWQFDLQALPADLISRGMAMEDPTAPHGLKLTIEDYPYANDGLLIWDAIKKWVTDYVTYYYPESNLVQSDDELQAWWTEIRTKGHADKKDKSWWPVLETPDDLIGIITNIIWVASGHHAAVNFGQYDFAGYFPNRPTITRTNMPTEDPNDTEKEEFMKKPEEFILKCFPAQVQAATVMAILKVLSTHSPDEEYLGKNIQPYWKDDKYINAMFEQFTGRLMEIEGIIDSRNNNENLLNRVGAGVVPYQLLKPLSEAGVTGKGVPNSISI